MLIDFTSRKVRVNLNKAIKGETRSEAVDAMDAREIETGRKYAIQATVVR